MVQHYVKFYLLFYLLLAGRRVFQCQRSGGSLYKMEARDFAHKIHNTDNFLPLVGIQLLLSP